MELNATYKAFFVLLRAGLWNRDPDLECFPLSPEVWKQVYVLANKQTVSGIIYDGIMRLPVDYFPPKNLLLKWTVLIASIEDRNKKMNRCVGELYAFFVENGIEVILVKGQGIATHYDNPLRRVCGDIDWFFPDRASFDRANRLIEEKQITVKKDIGFGTSYVWGDFVIEHHLLLLDITNPFLSGYLHRLRQREYLRPVYFNTEGQKITSLSPILTHLSVNLHILKHLLSFGISLRQVCDSARICYAYHDEEERNLLKGIYKKVGVYNWIQLLNRSLVDYLGMPEEYLPFPLSSRQKTDGMMWDILRGGNFGRYGDPFSKEREKPQIEKKHVWLHVLVRFGRYVRYAPVETCWYPVIHGYWRINPWFTR
jgi:hypothetical protein